MKYLAPRWPEISIYIMVGDANDVTQAVASRLCPIGISHSQNAHQTDPEPFLVDGFVAITSAASGLAVRKKISWTQLADHPFVMLPEHTSVRQLVDSAFRQAVTTPRVQLSGPTPAVVAGIVANGLGVSAMPTLALGLFDYPGLHRIRLTKPTLGRHLQILSAPDLAPWSIEYLLRQELRLFQSHRPRLPLGAVWLA